MATAAARAARNAEARKRLDTALAAVSKRLGVEIPPETRRMQDRDLQPIVEVERFAGIVEDILAALEGLARDEQPPAGYAALTVAMLREELDRRGIVPAVGAKKADLIADLERNDAGEEPESDPPVVTDDDDDFGPDA